MAPKFSDGENDCSKPSVISSWNDGFRLVEATVRGSLAWPNSLLADSGLVNWVRPVGIPFESVPV